MNLSLLSMEPRRRRLNLPAEYPDLNRILGFWSQRHRRGNSPFSETPRASRSRTSMSQQRHQSVEVCSRGLCGVAYQSLQWSHNVHRLEIWRVKPQCDERRFMLQLETTTSPFGNLHRNPPDCVDRSSMDHSHQAVEMRAFPGACLQRRCSMATTSTVLEMAPGMARIPGLGGFMEPQPSRRRGCFAEAESARAVSPLRAHVAPSWNALVTACNSCRWLA